MKQPKRGSLCWDLSINLPKTIDFLISIVSLASLFFFPCQNTIASGWTINPSLQFQETYSDNIKLAGSGNQTSAFVTEINPTLSIFRKSGRNALNLNYRMQNLYNASGNNSVNTFNQLQFTANNTLVPNKFFLNANSSISQQNTSNTQIANDNISGSGNRTNVNTFSLSPTWTPVFGNYASGSARVNFDSITTDDKNGSSTARVSDTFNLGELVQLHSGTHFKRISWNMTFNNSENYRVNGNNVRFQNSNITLRSHLNRYLNVFVQSGHSDNSFQTSLGNNGNGIFFTGGVQWLPSRFYNIEIGGGNNSHATLTLNPFRRLTSVTTIRDNQIGLNSGQTWQTAINYRTPRSAWSLSHVNDTTTTQALLLQVRVITLDVNPDPLINQPEQFLIRIPTLTDQVIVTKTWNFSFNFNTGKNHIGVNLFNQDRTFQFTGNNEKVLGINTSWNWQFAAKTSAYLSPRWQQIDRNLPQIDNRYDIAIGINRAINNHLNGRLEFRHLDQTSAISTNNFEENRATASVFLRF